MYASGAIITNYYYYCTCIVRNFMVSRVGALCDFDSPETWKLFRKRKIEIITLSIQTQRHPLTLGSPPNPLPAAVHYSAHTHTQQPNGVARRYEWPPSPSPAVHDFNWMLESGFPVRVEYLMIDILCALFHWFMCDACLRPPYLTLLLCSNHPFATHQFFFVPFCFRIDFFSSTHYSHFSIFFFLSPFSPRICSKIVPMVA